MKSLKTFAAICLFLTTLNAVSQTQTNKESGTVKYNTWSVALSGGSMLFYGDLRQFDFYPISKEDGKDWYGFTRDISERKYGFGVAVNKQLSTIFGIHGQFQSGKLCGVKRYIDNYFEANILEYGINGTVNFSNLFYPSRKNNKFYIYGIAGVEYIDFKTAEKKISTGEEVFSYGYGNYGGEKKKTTEVAIPVGLGVKYKLSKRIDIGIESIMNNINSDKLDAVVVPKTAKDKYGYTALTLTYKLGKNEKSLEWITENEMKSDDFSALITPLNKKIDSLGNRINELENKVAVVQKDVTDLKNPPVEIDDDGDGVPNSKDIEPNTPKGSLVDVNGRAITIPKEITTTVGASGISAPLFSVFFSVNSTFIDNFNQEKVVAAAKMLKENPNLKFELIGHADKTGGVLYNELLSKRRAQSVFDMLVKSFGIDPSRLTIIGKGISEPLSSDVYSVNRRVDFIVK